MKLRLIGLGKMGLNMAIRLLKGGRTLASFRSISHRSASVSPSAHMMLRCVRGFKSWLPWMGMVTMPGRPAWA